MSEPLRITAGRFRSQMPTSWCAWSIRATSQPGLLDGRPLERGDGSRGCEVTCLLPGRTAQRTIACIRARIRRWSAAGGAYILPTS